MSSQTKTYLLKRKSELEEQLKGYQPILDELAEINKAIAALTPKTSCNGCASGCDICRTGPYYR